MAVSPLAELLDNEMRARGLGLREFADDVLGVDHSIISRLLNGKQAGVSRRNIRRIAAGLGKEPAEIDALIPEAVAPAPPPAEGGQPDVAARIARLDPRVRILFYGLLQELEALTPEEAEPVLDDIEQYTADKLRKVGERRGSRRAARRRAS